MTKLSKEQQVEFEQWSKDFAKARYEDAKRYCEQYEEHEKDKAKSHERQRHELSLEIGSYMLKSSSLDMHNSCDFCHEDVMPLNELKKLLLKTLTDEEKQNLTYYQKKDLGISVNDEC